MTCRDVQDLLYPYSDGELDLVRHVEVEAHLVGCADCGERADNIRSLHSALSSPALYHRAPASLRGRICPERGPDPDIRARRRSWMRPLSIAAGILFLLGMTGIVAVLLPHARASAEEGLAEQLVADHVRSLQIDHLTDVASSDRHTVKPWFRGKLDFSPQAPDLSVEGFPLSGGRLDYLDKRPVAALVYFRRLHAINVFTWPSATGDEKPIRLLSRQGFHIRHWQRTGMTYWAISDLNEEELDAFARQFWLESVEAHP